MLHLKLLVRNGFLDNQPVKPGEWHLDGEVTIDVGPGLHVIDLLHMLNHMLDESFLVIIELAHVNCMLHRSLEVLIHANESLSHEASLERIRLVEEVWRVRLRHVRVHIINLAYADQFEPTHFSFFILDYLVYTVQVGLSQDVKFVF